MKLIEDIEQIVARETSTRAQHEVWRIGQGIAALPGVESRGHLERSHVPARRVAGASIRRDSAGGA